MWKPCSSSMISHHSLAIIPSILLLIFFSSCNVAFSVLVRFLGYIGSVSFLDTVLQVVERLRSVNPGLIYGKYF